VNDHGIILHRNSEVEEILPNNTMDEILFSFFPQSTKEDLSVQNALEVIAQLSPESYLIYEFHDDRSDFLSTVKISNSETVDDSIFSMEISKTVMHPSGKLIGTRLNLTESIKRSMRGKDVTENTVEIDISDNHSPIVHDLSMSTIEGNKVVPVPVPTRRHLEDVLEVLDRLNQHGFNAPNPSTT
jgi:hypothetical protein